MAVSTERDPRATRAALARWLEERTGASPVEVGEVTIPGLSGFSNETLLVDATWDGEEHGLVIRVEPTGHTLFPAPALDAQVRVMQALGAEGSVPVPEVLWFEEDSSVLGARFLCMGRVDGQVPADNPGYHGEGWMPALEPDGQRRVWHSGIDTMARIHRLDRGALGLEWIPEVAPDAQLQLDREYRHFACGDVPYPAVDEALDRLAATVPPATDRPALCWGDSRIGNMIFGADQQVAAVLDWEMVTAGDPVQDLAWYLLLDRHHVMAFDVPRLPGLPSRAESIARWEEASGHSARHLEWYELLGAARYAS
ncbi:MAG: phosphotransferase family protein, partial [Acidimicrobiales bacterium]|nr:phosphotransferase family protein [Acidimicrobiales bacterium]